MGRRIIIVIAFLFFAGAFLAPLVSSGQVDQSAEDIEAAGNLLNQGKLMEALSLLDKVVTRGEQEAGAAQANAQTKPGLLKKNLSVGQLAQMSVALILRGRVQTELLDCDRALDDCILGLAIAPETFAEYLAARAECYSCREEYDQAITDYSAALKAKFLSPSPQASAGIYEGRARAFWAQGKHDQALADFDQAIRFTPQNRMLYEDRIKDWESMGKLRKAVEEVSRLIGLAPGEIKLYLDRASRYEILGDYENALKDYATVLTMAKDKETKLQALERRATIFEVQTSDGQDRNAEAEAEYTALLKLEPGNSKWLSMRARVKLRKEDTQGALADFNECIKRAPGQGWPYRLRGGAYYDLGEYDQAIKDLNQALKLDPGDAQANYLRGVVKVSQKDFQGAIADYDIALAKYPQADTYFEARGKAYWGLGERNKAMQDFTSAVEIKPTDPYYRHLRGSYYLDLNQLDNAQADFSKALELDPNYIDSVAGLADVAFFSGNYRKARAGYTTYLKSRPQSSMAYYRRGESS